MDTQCDDLPEVQYDNLPYLSGDGVMTPSLYTLYALIDDFGTFVTPPELDFDSYANRYYFFHNR